MSYMEAGSYMEPAAAWGRPCEFQMASWSSVEEPGAQAAWDPAGLPIVVDYASTDEDVFGNSSSLQPYLHSSSSLVQQHQQLALYNYDYSAPTQLVGDQSTAVAPSDDYAMGVFESVTVAFKDEAASTTLKMHRFPASITRALGKSYTVPRVVAIGPYHHRRQELMMAEKVKHVAAYHCINNSGCTVRQNFDAIVSVADGARSLYDKDVMASISNDDFRHMMFFDACFLVQYMLWESGGFLDPTLFDFMESNKKDILHDVMLLENQIPWRVVDSVMYFTTVNLGMLISRWRGRLQDCIDDKDEHMVLQRPNQANYNDPPHYLGFILFHIVGSSNTTGARDKHYINVLSSSVSAVELVEMGIIKLKANQATEPAHRGLVYMKDLSTLFFPELSMMPLSLDSIRASWLLSMVAIELCTTPDFLDNPAEDSATFSYLLLLCMLVHREEDVHLLRTKGILQGRAGLTNKEALLFFTSLHSCLRPGPYYEHVMVQIESYRNRMWIWIKLYAFVYKNIKTIVAVGSAIGAFACIIKTLQSLKGTHH